VKCSFLQLTNARRFLFVRFIVGSCYIKLSRYLSIKLGGRRGGLGYQFERMKWASNIYIN